MLLKNKIQESIKFIETKTNTIPQTAVILGSGLGGFADSVKNPIQIDTGDIPHYPKSTVPGHSGKWIIGDQDGTSVLAIQGRVHFYEGYTLEVVTYPIHLLASLGVKNLIVTTSSGGLNPNFNAGDLMLITDQLNWTFNNPLIGKPENQLGPRFPDMSEPYDKDFQELAKSSAKELGISLQQGVFAWVTGPNYETAAEVRMLHKLGGDAVSMSTAPEVIVAKQRHLKVLGISLITNPGTGLSPNPLSHQEVTEAANKAGDKMGRLLTHIIQHIPV